MIRWGLTSQHDNPRPLINARSETVHSRPSFRSAFRSRRCLVPATGFFEIIDEDELQAIVDSGQDLPKLSRPSDVTAEPLHDYADDEHLSLVSAQALRQVIVDDEKQDDEAESTDAGEFNPYYS